MTAVVLGVLTGLTIGLMAVGIVLVYKANRFINLAHGQLGIVAAVLLSKFAVDLGWSWWVAFPVCLGLGVLSGLVVERVVIRRVRAATRNAMALLLVTIGVAQLFLALTYVKALKTDEFKLLRAGYPLPFDRRLTIFGVTLDSADLLILMLVPAVAIALGLFLRYSVTGKTIRAAATNPDAARLCGISVSRVSAVTWGIAGGLSALTAVLLAPHQPNFNVQVLGPSLLLRALGAAALGGFVSVPWALAGGLALGVAEHTALQVTHNGGVAELVVFVAVLAILFFRGRAITRVAAESTEGLAETRPPTRIPAAVRNRAIVRYQRLWLALAGVGLAAVLPLLPYFRPEHRRFELVLVLLYAMIGVTLTMVIGWSGQVSLGHFALVGVGAYITARYSPDWSLPLLLLAAGAAGAAVMVIVGLPALRLQGLTLAVTTLGLAVVAPAWLFKQTWFGSAQQAGQAVEPVAIMRGLGRPTDQLTLYFIALVVLVLVLLAASALQRSVPGRLAMAVRDNEAAAASFGVAPSTIKLAILAVSGAMAAATGVLWAASWQTVAVAHFSPQLSLAVLAIPVIGGLGSLAGAAAGVLLYMATFFLSPVVESLFGSTGQQIGFQLAMGGLAMVFIPIAHPTGLAGIAQHEWEAILGRIAERVRPATEGDLLPLVVDGVNVHFGGVQALDEAAIAVGPGEIVGLIGPNGAGKTTLLNVISGVLQSGSGSVRLFGEEVVGLPPELRPSFGLGRSFQSAHLFPGLTVTETVQVALSRSGRVGVLSSLVGAPWGRALERRSRREAAEIVERVGLTPWADTLVSDLSTGMRRICDLAAQVAARPKVLLLDEPTAGVAQREAEAFGPLLRRIRDELDCSIVLVEHDMPLLMGLCDRVFAMDTGRVIAVGRPEEIRTNPVVIASYLGTDEVAITRSGHGRVSGNGNGNGNGRRPRRTRPLTASRKASSA